MSEELIVYEGRIPFKVAYFSHRGWWYLLWGWNFGLLASWLKTLGETIKITTQRVVLTTGILSKDVEEVEYYRVQDTAYHQSFLERIVGIGTITLFSRDKTAPIFSFLIHEPDYFREEIRRCMKGERRRMRTMQFD
jgi:membrane protein YdbS with pleckstrin-like domain